MLKYQNLLVDFNSHINHISKYNKKIDEMKRIIFEKINKKGGFVDIERDNKNFKFTEIVLGYIIFIGLFSSSKFFNTSLASGFIFFDSIPSSVSIQENFFVFLKIYSNYFLLFISFSFNFWHNFLFPSKMFFNFFHFSITLFN